jgi:heterodisulfide reductase subunit A
MTPQPVGSVLVVGGGVCGVKAALDLVECGYFVHIVEKRLALGGVMAQLDKIFPTNDCSLCLLAPQMVECDRNQNVRLHTNSVLLGLEGEPGRFTASIWRQPAYIDMDKCVACHECVEVCPRSAPDEFNQNLNQRKAAYILYRQAVPLQYVIDADNCLRFSRSMGGACEAVCPADAINFQDEGSVEQVEAGAVVLAPGLETFDPGDRDIWGYKRFPDVVTSLEFERLISASGPDKGRLRRRSDLAEPRRIAWLQCVGSRDLRRPVCSNICCMYAIKQAMAAPEHLASGSLEAVIFFTDIRTPGKGHEELFNAAREQGVQFVRARPHTVLPGPKGRGVELTWATEDGRLESSGFDMLVLSVGMVPGRDAATLCRMLGVALNRFDFVQSSSFAPHRTSRPGVFAAGGVLGPKDIPQTVVEAAAVSAAATAELAPARWSRVREPPEIPERDVSGEAPRVGVFLCGCGTSTASVLDLDALAGYAAGLEHVAYVEINAFTCPQASQERIVRLIREKGLNRVVVGACTPKTHEPLYKQTLRRAGLNPALLEMANLRNHVAWVHHDQPQQALAKARGLIRGAAAKAALLRPAEALRKRVTRRALVVGGGVAGMTAALALADQGVETVLVEKGPKLGGIARRLRATWVGEDFAARLEESILRVRSSRLVTVLTRSRVVSSRGSAGDFTVRLETAGETGESLEREMRFGAVILCMGGRERETPEHLHGEHPRVLTQLEFDQFIRTHPNRLQEAKRVAFIQCVGSRQPDKPYCSRVCCTHTIETCLKLKEMNPALDLMVFHRDVRTFGQREMHYHQALSQGVLFVRYEPERKPEVRPRGEGLEVRAWDAILGRTLAVEADYLVLAVAIEPGPETRKLADVFRCNVDGNGFLLETRRFMKPVDLTVHGVFAAGLCHSPMPVDEVVSQAQAAAFRACRILCRDEMALDSLRAELTPSCDGCGLCVAECPYGAISGVPVIKEGEERLEVRIDPMLCEGCGICQAVCPVEGIEIPGFTPRQVRAQALALAEGPPADAEGFEPRIVAFCCNWCAYVAADMAGVLRLKYPPNVRILRVMCAGMVDQHMVPELLRGGADGVAILGCRPGECNYGSGNSKAAAWAQATRDRLEQAGFSPERFMVGGAASSEGGLFAEMVARFTERIRELGPASAEAGSQETEALAGGRVS